MSIIVTQAAFLHKARAKHADKYDYSKAFYVNASTKLTIICPEHGAFEMLPGNHTNKSRPQGCWQCSNSAQRATLESFVERASAVHGGLYDYSQAVYTLSKIKINIICPQHGLFKQSPNAHLAGRGCPKCAGVFEGDIERFIKAARAVHGGKYSYGKAVYTFNSKKIEIVCPEHGPYFQCASNHLAGQGCPACVGKQKDTAVFIEQAQKAHGERYNYSLAEYSCADGLITIVCSTHGPFKQRAISHLRGHGCEKCSRQERCKRWGAKQWAECQAGRKALLYVVQLEDNLEKFYKVGITFSSVKKRFSDMAKLYGVKELALYSSNDANFIHGLEATVKRDFKHIRYMPSKEFGGHTECYANSDLIIAFLSNYASTSPLLEQAT